MALVHEAHEDVAAAHVGAHIGANFGDEDAVRERELLLLLRGQFRNHDAEAMRRRARLALGLWRGFAPGDAVLFPFADRDGEGAAGALAPDLEVDLAAGPDGGHVARQVALRVDQLAVHFGDDVARFDARALGRAALLDRDHQPAARPVPPEGRREVPGDFLDRYADLAA